MKRKIKIISVLLIISLLSVQCVVVKKDKETDKKDSLGKIKNTLQNFKDNQNNKKIEKEEINANKKALKEKEKLEKQQLKEEKQIEKNLAKRNNYLKNNYKIETAFLMSDNAGKSYVNMTKEFKIGEPVYMKMSIKLLQARIKITEGKQYNIECNLQISGVDISNSKFYDGAFTDDMIPVLDKENNIIKYNIKLPIEKIKNEKEYIFTFQFTPKSNSEIVSKLVFEDAMQIYNTQNTIRFTK